MACLPDLSPMGDGVQAEVTDSDLALVGNVRGHPGIELQIIHHLRLLPRAVPAPAITDLGAVRQRIFLPVERSLLTLW